MPFRRGRVLAELYGQEDPNNARGCEGQNSDAGCPQMIPSHTYVLKLYSYCEKCCGNSMRMTFQECVSIACNPPQACAQ